MSDPLDLRDDAALEELLAGLRGPTGAAPFAVDVEARVMARIAFAGPIPRNEVGLGQLARWATAAAAAGVALLATAASKAPSVPELVEVAGRTTVEGTTLAVKTGGTVTVLGSALARSGAVLLEAGRATVASMAPWQGLIGAAVTASALIMLAVTTYVVARDFRATTR